MTTVYSSASLLGNHQTGWQAVINELYTSLDINIPDRPDFFGRISHTSLGPVEITEVLTDREQARRTRRHISRDTEESFLYILQTRGSVQISQFDREDTLYPGSFTLLDLTSPYVFQHADRIEMLGIKIPGGPLYTRATDPHRHCGIVRTAQQGLAKVTADFFRSVRNEIRSVHGVGESLAPTIIDLAGLLLNVANDDLPTGETVLHAAIRRRCVAFIETNLGDPALRPDTIAKAMGISVRHLHRVFQSGGESIGDLLRKRRLQKARNDLLDRRKEHLLISEIAYRNGFSSACYFADAFKAEFGVTPRAFRNDGG